MKDDKVHRFELNFKSANKWVYVEAEDFLIFQKTLQHIHQNGLDFDNRTCPHCNADMGQGVYNNDDTQSRFEYRCRECKAEVDFIFDNYDTAPEDARCHIDLDKVEPGKPMDAKVIQWIHDERGTGRITVYSGKSGVMTTEEDALKAIAAERKRHFTLRLSDPIRSLIEGGIIDVTIEDYETEKVLAKMPVAGLLHGHPNKENDSD